MPLSSPLRSGRPRSIALGVLTLATIFALAPAMARASTAGALFQDPGPAGCIRELGGGGCATGWGLNEASQVAASPDGRNLYVASAGGNNDEGSVAVFLRDSTTGAATQLSGSAGCVAEAGTSGPSTCTVGIGLLGATGVTVSPDGKFVYTVGQSWSSDAQEELAAIAIFSRDPGTGALTQLPGIAGCLSTTGPEGDARCATTSGELGDLRRIIISSDGKFAYVASPDTPSDSGQVRVFSRDLATGALTAAGCVKETPDATGCALGRGLYEPTALTLSPDGHQLYVAASEGVNSNSGDSDGAVVTFDRDVATGALTQPADSAGCANSTGDDGSGADTCALAKGLHDANDIAVSADGKSVYLANQGGYVNNKSLGTLSVFKRDTSTGRLTQLAGTAGCVSQDTGDGYTNPGVPGVCAKGRGMAEVTSVTVSPDNSFVYVTSSDQPGGAVSVFSRDPSTGGVTQLDGAAGCLSRGGQDGDGGTTCTNGNGLEGANAVIALANVARPGCLHLYGASENDDALFVLSRQVECAPAAIIAPKVTTGSASGVTSSAVQLTGKVDPSKASTTYTFEYGTSTAYGLQSATGSLAASDGEKALSTGIDGLQPSRTYHYRLVATNSGGTARGQDLTFTTPRAITPRPTVGKVTMSVKRKLRRGLPRYYVVSGRVVLPAGVQPSDGCTGLVSVRIRTGTHTVSTRLVKLGKDCRYRASMHPNVHKRSRLKVSARFMGNAAFRAMSAKSRSIRA